LEAKSNPGAGNALKTRKSALITLGIITLAVALALVFFRQIHALAQKWLLPCPLLTLADIRCPLCGGTRCASALVRFDILEALYYNPLVIAGVIYFVYKYAALAAACLRREYRPHSIEIGEKGLCIIMAVCIIFFIVRNLPFYRMYFY